MALHHFHERVDESPRQDENFDPSGAPVAFFVSEIWLFVIFFIGKLICTLRKEHLHRDNIGLALHLDVLCFRYFIDKYMPKGLELKLIRAYD